MRIELTTEDIKRFEAKVDRSGGPDACHPRTGGGYGQGYGAFWVGNRTERAHRVAWVLAGNTLTHEKPCVLHNCPGGDNRLCCNNRHLWAGTRAENQRDMAKKNRGTKSPRGLPFGALPKRNGRFTARAWIDGKTIYFGTYDTAEEAQAVAIAAKNVHLTHGGRRTPR